MDKNNQVIPQCLLQRVVFCEKHQFHELARKASLAAIDSFFRDAREYNLYLAQNYALDMLKETADIKTPAQEIEYYGLWHPEFDFYPIDSSLRFARLASGVSLGSNIVPRMMHKGEPAVEENSTTKEK